MNFKALLKTYYPALLIGAVLVSFSIYAFYETAVVIADRRAKLFDMRVQQVKETLEKRIDNYIQILKGCQSAFYISDTVTAAEWKEYTRNLQLSSEYPGILAIAYAAYISKDEISKMEKALQKSGHKNFKIHSTFKNDHLTPIIYIEPFSGRNLRAFGYDMFSEKNRNAAIKRAMLTGEASITRKVILVQETNKNVQPGFLLYLPVYKNPKIMRTAADRERNIKGFVYNAFRAHDLMGTVLKKFSDVNIEVFDGSRKNPANTLYNSASELTQNEKNKTEFIKTVIIETAGAHWTLRVSSAKEFGSSIERRQPVLILIIGLFITLLLTAASILLIKRKSEVLNELNLTKELEKKKDEFIGIASHELKTPLTSIKAYLQLLERSELKVKEKFFVDKANSQIHKLSKLISDLLDVSKIEAGKLELNISLIRLEDLISDSVENVEHIYQSHKIIKPEALPHAVISGDHFRLEQAITNLLGNAVKYSPGAEEVYINASIKNNKVQIEIKDSGIGISPADQQHVFDKFFRSKELSPVLSGLGMGLYIAHEIIKRHGGDILVESEPGKGTTFSISLPLAS